ncbi:TPA: hypothetical protein PXP51_001580 [Yersinia enterocolitica]|nr:hypothetical protein [Yersinia enterocolitica]HEN3478675.1 hypothetical protein [Yersinia enterocolitica]
MSGYGLKVFRPDGTSIVLDNTTTMTKIVAMGSKTLTYGEWNTGVTIPEGYDYFLWMTSNAWLNYIVVRHGRRSQWTPGGQAYNRVHLDTNRVLKVNSVNYNTAVLATYYSVCIWPTATPQGRYGVQFYGADHLSGISDVSQFSCLLFKGEVDIYNGWLPSHINPAFTPNNVMCFFYTEDASKTISVRAVRRYRTPATMEGFGVFNVGGGASATPVRAKICLFGQGPLNRSQYGMEIYSRLNGSVVYNSGYDILARPRLVTLAGAELGAMRPVDGVRRPMYAPCNIGGLFSHPWQVEVWVNSNGTQIGPAWGTAFYKEASTGAYTYFIAPVPIMVLDASDYFHF